MCKTESKNQIFQGNCLKSNTGPIILKQIHSIKPKLNIPNQIYWNKSIKPKLQTESTKQNFWNVKTKCTKPNLLKPTKPILPILINADKLNLQKIKVKSIPAWAELAPAHQSQFVLLYAYLISSQRSFNFFNSTSF